MKKERKNVERTVIYLRDNSSRRDITDQVNYFDNGDRNDKTVNLCVLFNTITYIIIYIVSLYVICRFVDTIIIRIILGIISFFFCGFVEEKILSHYVSSFVVKIMKKKK